MFKIVQQTRFMPNKKNREMKRILIICLTILLFGSFTGCGNSEKELKTQGNELVKKVEEYKKNTGKLPSGLKDMGLEESMEGPLFYERKDSVNYMIWFGTTLGESMIYYSDTKEWDYRLRGMGDKKPTKK